MYKYSFLGVTLLLQLVLLLKIKSNSKIVILHLGVTCVTSLLLEM